MSILSRTCLTRIEARKLEDMVEQYRKEFEEGKWTYQSFADHATQRMNLPVTKSNVSGACRTMGVQLRPKKNKVQSSEELERRTEDLRRVLRDVARQLSMVMKCIDLEPEQEFWTAKDWLELLEEEDEERNE